MIRTLKIFLVLVVLIGFALFLRSTDWQAVAKAMQSIGWNALWLLLFTLLSGILGSLAWQYCITQGRDKVHFLHLFLIRHIGETIGLLNPTGIIAGDGVKAGLLGQKGIQPDVALTSIVVSRSLTMLSHFAVFILAGFIINPMFGLKAAGVFLFACLMIWFFMKLLGPIWSRNKSHWLERLRNRNGQAWIDFGKRLRGQLQLLFKFDRRALWIAFILLALHWVMGAAEFWIILKLLNAPITMPEAVLIDSGVGFFKAAGILIPGQLGVEEYGNKVMLDIVGVHDQAIWITASILRRARQIFWILFGIAVYFISYHQPKKAV